MTNTLHRYGDAESLKNDFIVFAIPARGKNDAGCVPKLRKFLRMALKHHPVNIGDGSKGGMYRPSQSLNPLVHWSRDNEPEIQAVIEKVSGATVVAAVFDDEKNVQGFVRELREADLGLSINISATIAGAHACCREAGLARHSVEYSLGFMGKTDRLAERPVLELSTMCGHGMVSFGLARKMIDWVKEGRRTPEQAAVYLCRFCSCGIYNPVRACAILEKARKHDA
jgi:hypothetical protein